MNQDDTKAYLKDAELDEADRVLLRLYEKANEPIDRDESDDAILNFAHSVSAEFTGSVDIEGQSIKATEPDAHTEISTDDMTAADEDSNIVSFSQRKRTTNIRYFYRSPAAGFSIAATLAIGIFAGQIMTPYVDFDVTPNNENIAGPTQSPQKKAPLTRSIKILGAGGQRQETSQTPAGDQPQTAEQPPAQPPAPTTNTLENQTAALEQQPTPAAPVSDLKQVSAILNGVRCANLSMTLSHNGDIKISGYVAKLEDLQKVRSNLAELPSLGPVTDNISIYAWPVCGALGILAQYTNQGTNASGGAAIRPVNHGLVYLEGENLIFEAQNASQRDVYLYVDFVQSDGSVVHLLPFNQNPKNKFGPGEKAILGGRDVQYAVSGPFGTELITVIASPVPLFDGLRDEVEKADAYFSQLKQALSRRVAQGHGAQISSAYNIITTKSK